jgi:hypothetical protein
MRATVFVGTSVDGFLARPNGDFDFLDHGGNVEHGYEAFMATVDVLVIGRGTFEAVLKFETWPYGTKRSSSEQPSRSVAHPGRVASRGGPARSRARTRRHATSTAASPSSGS